MPSNYTPQNPNTDVREGGPDRPPRISAEHWRLAIVAGMASYLDSGLLISGGISLAIWKSHYGIDALQLGIVSATLTFCVALGAFFGGRLADMLGRRLVFNVDILIYVIGAVMIVFAPDVYWLTAGVAIAGLAAGADLPTSVAVVSELAPKGASGRMVALTQVMWSVGILVAVAIGFACSSMGILGVQLLFAHLAIVGLATWAVRVFSPSFRRMEEQAVASNEDADTAQALPLRKLLGSSTYIRAIVLTCLFYVAWNLMANTIGQFKAFYLVTVNGASQALATALMVPTNVLAVLGGLMFVRLIDTKYRRTVFYIGAVGQIVAMCIAAVSGGTALLPMIICFIVYSAFHPFAGEAMYKVWTQESFPVNARATVQGLTYSVSRLVCAAVAVFTPMIVEANPAALLWLLVGCAVMAALVGSLIIGTGKGRPEARDTKMSGTPVTH